MIRRRARLAAAAVVLALPACATVLAPPGGPEDKTAPQLLATRPDTSALLTGWRGPVVFAFDETLSEAGVDSSVSLSPVRGGVSVDQKGGEIRVQPRRGWLPGQIYQIEVAPGLSDRFSNRRTEGIRLVFSTGPAIPATAASGVVTERVTGTAARVRVDAVRTTDSLTYTTQTDSAGGFRFAQVPEGEYRVTAYRDANRNYRTDVFEARDTARFVLAVGAAPTARLSILLPDSTAPRPGSASSSADSAGWIEVRFDDYLDPAQTLTPAQITLVGPDSLPVPVAEVRVGEPPAAARDSAAADSAGRPAQADTARRAPAPRTPAPGRAARADSVRADTTPAGPLPSQVLSIRPARALPANTAFRITITGVRNINGLVGGGEIPLRTPRPAPAPATRPAAPAADSARAPAVREPSEPKPSAPEPAVPAPAPSTPPRPSSAAPAVVPPRTPSASRSSSSGF